MSTTLSSRSFFSPFCAQPFLPLTRVLIALRHVYLCDHQDRFFLRMRGRPIYALFGSFSPFARHEWPSSCLLPHIFCPPQIRPNTLASRTFTEQFTSPLPRSPVSTQPADHFAPFSGVLSLRPAVSYLLFWLLEFSRRSYLFLFELFFPIPHLSLLGRPCLEAWTG